MILVTGATGNVGSALVRQLADGHVPVRALVRDPARAKLPDAAEPYTGDLNEPDTLKAGLDGVDGVFLLAGYDDLPVTLDLMRQAGVKRVVLLSGGAATSSNRDNPITRYQTASEADVQGSGLSWTILRPSGFMTNTMQWAEQLKAGDRVRAPFADVRVANIDPCDIAAVAARALTSDGHDGQTYRLTGPQSLLPSDRAQILGEALGRDLGFEAQPHDEAYAEMAAAMPVEYANAFFSFYQDGTLDESPVSDAVPRVLDRPGRTFAHWCRENAGAFA